MGQEEERTPQHGGSVSRNRVLEKDKRPGLGRDAGLGQKRGYPEIRENPSDENQELSWNSSTIKHWGEGERG